MIIEFRRTTTRPPPTNGQARWQFSSRSSLRSRLAIISVPTLIVATAHPGLWASTRSSPQQFRHRLIYQWWDRGLSSTSHGATSDQNVLGTVRLSYRSPNLQRPARSQLSPYASSRFSASLYMQTCVTCNFLCHSCVTIVKYVFFLYSHFTCAAFVLSV